MLAGWLTSERLSGTVTFLFTDIEGSTGLLKQLGRERYGEVLARHQVLLREAFAAHGGEEIDTQGDSFFVALRSASDAVAAAVAIQRSLADHEWPDGAELRVRIGIHTGEAASTGERFVGVSVHRAARIGAAAHGGQVLISQTTHDLLEDEEPATAGGSPTALPQRLWAAGFGVLWLSTTESDPPDFRQRSYVTTYDPISGQIEAKNAVGARGGELVVDSALGIWVLDQAHEMLLRVDPATKHVVDRIALGHYPCCLSAGHGHIWVALESP